MEIFCQMCQRLALELVQLNPPKKCFISSWNKPSIPFQAMNMHKNMHGYGSKLGYQRDHIGHV